MMNKRNLLLALTLMFSASAAHALIKASGWVEPEGFVSPESVLEAWDGPDGRIYVSEIGEFGKDGDGKVRFIDTEGQVHPFADGMDDPKGLAMAGENLYVADKQGVLKITRDGKWTVFAAAGDFPAPLQFPNDLEADAKGNIYLSDTGDLKGQGGAIYRISKTGKITRVKADDTLISAPNGLLMDGNDGLLVVDFVSGILYRVQLSTGKTTKIAEGFGGGDGIARGKDGTLYVSDWKGGKVFSVSKKGTVKLIKDGLQSAADITVDKSGWYVLVPDMKAGRVIYLPIK
ncbi:MAG: SMP-30/gluconolactonase/LRE family protein [Methylobacillus sp.]|jgi:sugar lactone lactonase YvrE|nr:SMP-30/gluconolactonase/LRE family protein [Methylobacillus sp.]